MYFFLYKYIKIYIFKTLLDNNIFVAFEKLYCEHITKPDLSTLRNKGRLKLGLLLLLLPLSTETTRTNILRSILPSVHSSGNLFQQSFFLWEMIKATQHNYEADLNSWDETDIERKCSERLILYIYINFFPLALCIVKSGGPPQRWFSPKLLQSRLIQISKVTYSDSSRQTECRPH